LKKKLSEIASIRTGIFLKPSDNGNCIYVQPKYFDNSGELVTELEPDVNTYSFSGKHLLEEGDILFAAKGTRNFTTSIKLNGERAAASTSFFVIKTNHEIIPGYIKWYLNQPSCLNLLKRQAKGSAMASISKKTLANIEIPIPEIDKQNTIIKISELRKTEKKLTERLTMKMDQLIHANIFNSLKSN